MKKNLLAALLGVALLSSAAAQAEDTYVSVGAGRSEYKLDGDSENKTAISLAFGQSLGENWGYELGYLNFGSLPMSGDDEGVIFSDKLRVQSVYAAAVGTLPISEAFSLFAKAGLSLNYAKVKGTATENGESFGYKDSDTKVGPMLGVGLAYNFTKQVAAMAEYRYFHEVIDGGVKASALTAGIRYSF